MPYYPTLAGLSGSFGTTDNAIPRANGTTGTVVQGSGVTITDNDDIITPDGSAFIHSVTPASWSGSGVTLWSYTPDLGDGFYWVELRVAISRTDTGPSYRFSTWQAAFSVSSGTPTRISSVSGGEEENLLNGGYAPSEVLGVSGNDIIFTSGTTGGSGKYIVFPTITFGSGGIV